MALTATFAVQAQARGQEQDAASPATTTLQTLTVNGISNQASMRPGALRSDLVKTETISEQAIARVAATNINEALDKNPGIAVQVECSICNVRNVVLDNLPGRYTTLMVDGVPIFSSVSSAYGLDSVSVYGIERIDISRGAGASLIAPEALSGAVNIVTKRPTSDESRARLQLGNYGSRQADAYLAQTFSGGAFTATVNYNKHDSVDGDHNGLSEYTGYDRRLGSLGYFLDDADGFKVRGRLDLVNEKRGGGAMGTDYAAIKANTQGNPFDFSRGEHGSPVSWGWVVPDPGSPDFNPNLANLLRPCGAQVCLPYDDGRGGFSEIIFTRRTQFITTAERRFDDSLLRLAFGAAEHKQDSFYETTRYIGKQRQYYGEISWQMPVGDWLLTTGANLRFENLRSHGSTGTSTNDPEPKGEPINGIDSYTYRTPAVFVQAYRAFFDDALEVNGSVRYDRHNVLGDITSPRLNLLYHHTDYLSSRFSAGKGFRAPTSFFEQDHGILNTLRIQRDIDKPEVSKNLSYALSYADDRLAVTGSYNYNRIEHFALLDPDATDDTGQPITVFSSSPKPVTVQGADVNLSYLLTPAVTLMAAAEGWNYTFPAGTLVFARPRSKAYLGLDYSHDGFDFSTKTVWTGTMDLNKFHDNGAGSQDRYNFDGTPKLTRSPSFATVDLHAEYAFTRKLSVYAGADNVFDYKQTDKESPLFVDAGGNYDVVQLWGPMLGRYVYVGMKASF